MPKLRVPTNSYELEDILSDKAKVDQYVLNGQFQELVQNYARTVNANDPGLEQQLALEVERGIAQFLRDNRDAVPATNKGRMLAGSMQGTRHNPRAVGASIDGIFDDAGEYLQTIHHSLRPQHLDGKASRLRNAVSETVPADGGFLVPERLRSELLALSLETGIVRPKARVIPMDSLRVPIPSVDDTSHASTVLGGISGGWVAESQPIPASQAAFGRVVLDAKKLAIYFDVPNELVNDALAFNEFVGMTVPQAISYFEDVAFLTGAGSADPLGVLNASAMVTAPKITGQPAGSIVWENLVAMYARMLPQSLNRAVWVANISTFPQLATMALSVGTGGGPIWMGWVPGQTGADAPPMSILGRPIYFTEKVPDLGSPGDITLLDLSYYLIGDRMTMQAISSIHFRFQNDQTSYRFIERADGRPWINTALTPRQGANTLSPFVQIAQR